MLVLSASQCDMLALAGSQFAAQFAPSHTRLADLPGPPSCDGCERYKVEPLRHHCLSQMWCGRFPDGVASAGLTRAVLPYWFCAAPDGMSLQHPQVDGGCS